MSFFEPKYTAGDTRRQNRNRLSRLSIPELDNRSAPIKGAVSLPSSWVIHENVKDVQSVRQTSVKAQTPVHAAGGGHGVPDKIPASEDYFGQHIVALLPLESSAY